MDPNEPATEPAVNDTTAAIQRILEDLLPEAGEQVEWRDVTGTVHRAPAAASIRVQARVATIAGDAVRSVGKTMQSGGNLVALLGDPAVLDALRQAMEIVHPTAVRRARTAIAEGDPELREAILLQAGVGSVDDLTVLDLFSAEAVVDAIGPFFAGPLLRLLELAGPLLSG